MRVGVSEPPGPPRKVSVEGVGKTCATLTWKAPEFDGGSPITGYYVERMQVWHSQQHGRAGG